MSNGGVVMEWSTAKPTKLGWYWWREIKDGVCVRRLVQEITETHLQFGVFYGEWAGPIHEPTEPQEAGR
jgi:hypothetical protein